MSSNGSADRGNAVSFVDVGENVVMSTSERTDVGQSAVMKSTSATTFMRRHGQLYGRIRHTMLGFVDVAAGAGSRVGFLPDRISMRVPGLPAARDTARVDSKVHTFSPPTPILMVPSSTLISPPPPIRICPHTIFYSTISCTISTVVAVNHRVLCGDASEMCERCAEDVQ